MVLSGARGLPIIHSFFHLFIHSLEILVGYSACVTPVLGFEDTKAEEHAVKGVASHQEDLVSNPSSATPWLGNWTIYLTSVCVSGSSSVNGDHNASFFQISVRMNCGKTHACPACSQLLPNAGCYNRGPCSETWFLSWCCSHTGDPRTPPWMAFSAPQMLSLVKIITLIFEVGDYEV